MRFVKKVIALLITVVILATTLSSIALAGREVSYTEATVRLPWRGIVATTSSNLNVRAGAGTNYRVIGSFPRGHQLHIVGGRRINSPGMVWYRVHFNSTASVGYVSSELVTIPNLRAQRVWMVSTQGGNLHFRRTDSSTGDILGSAPNSTRVPQVSGTVSNSFRNVVYRGLGGGWMHRDFLATPPAN